METVEHEIYIKVGMIEVRGEGAGDEVRVARVGKTLYFARNEEADFVLAIADQLDGNGNPAADFELSVSAAGLRRALRRVAEQGVGHLEGEGDLLDMASGSVVFEAPCGERFEFARADLEDVVDEFCVR